MADFRFRIKRGDDWVKTLEFYSDAALTQPLDLTGYSAAMDMVPANGVVALRLSTDNGRIAIAGHIVTLTLAHAETVVPWNVADTDLKLIDPGGQVKHWLHYPVVIEPTVTA